MARRHYLMAIALGGLCGLTLLATNPQRADAAEGGISFWLPGLFGSMAAVPGTPGWSWATIYYHPEVGSGANAQFPRGGRIDLGIAGQGDLIVFGPTYTFGIPELGGAVGSVSVFAFGGRSTASVSLGVICSMVPSVG